MTELLSSRAGAPRGAGMRYTLTSVRVCRIARLAGLARHSARGCLSNRQPDVLSWSMWCYNGCSLFVCGHLELRQSVATSATDAMVFPASACLP